MPVVVASTNEWSVAIQAPIRVAAKEAHVCADLKARILTTDDAGEKQDKKFDLVRLD
jgi:hypothetical protein